MAATVVAELGNASLQARINRSHQLIGDAYTLLAQTSTLRGELRMVVANSVSVRRQSRYVAPRRIFGGADDPAGVTTTRILRFLQAHVDKVFCSRCVSDLLFNGRKIDVAMHHSEGRGIRRHHGRCSECGKPRLVAGVIVN